MIDLDAIYGAIDSADDLDNLPSAIARLCGSRSAMVTRLGPTGEQIYGRMSYWSPEVWLAYFTGHFIEDPWRNVVQSVMAPGRAIAADAYLPPERFVETAMYNECFRAIGDDTARCTGVISKAGGKTLIIGIHRAGGDRAFDPEDVAKLDIVHSHVKRVFQARDAIDRTEVESLRAAEMLEATGVAVVAVDASLAVLRMSGAAKQIFDGRDGLGFRAGKLVLDDMAAMQLLRAAVSDVVNRRPGSANALLCPRSSTRPWYRIVVLPAGTTHSDGALVIIDDPADHRAGVDRLKRFARAYGLTSAETSLAARLAHHETLDEIAEARGVTRETIRTQLKSLFWKTGVHRQVELAKLIDRMP